MTTKLANLYLSIERTFAYTETIEVPVDFNEDDLQELVQARINQVNKDQMVYQEGTTAYGRCFAEDTTEKDPHSELSGLTVKPVLYASKNSRGDVLVHAKAERPLILATSVGVDAATFETIKHDFDVFNNDAVKTEMILDISAWDEVELSHHLHNLLPDEDVNELMGMSYVAFYIVD